MTALTTEQIKEIAYKIDCGFACHWNIKNNRLIFIPSNEEFEYDDSSAWDKEIKELKLNSSEYREIEKPDSRESFKMLEGFIDELPDNTRIKGTLIEAVNKRKPFSEFKYGIDNAGEYRQLWFDFKDQKRIEYVQERIEDIMMLENPEDD